MDQRIVRKNGLRGPLSEYAGSHARRATIQSAGAGAMIK